MATTNIRTIKTSGGDYSSLTAWEAGRQGDLVANDYIEEAICYAKLDTSAVNIDGWTTGVNNYIYIHTDPTAKHPGKWDTSKYYIEGYGSGYAMVEVNESYTIIDGLQAHNMTTWGDSNGFRIRAATGVHIRKCIGRADGSAQHGFMDDDNAISCYIYNNLAYGCGGYGFCVHKTAYNCTSCHNGLGGFEAPYWAATYVNCLAHGNTGGDFLRGGSDTLTLNNCASSDGTADDFAGANNRVNQTFTFVDHDNNDFHLAAADAGAQGYGMTDPGSGLFSDDIDGEERS